jgi:hypothetical protein
MIRVTIPRDGTSWIRSHGEYLLRLPLPLPSEIRFSMLRLVIARLRFAILQSSIQHLVGPRRVTTICSSPIKRSHAITVKIYFKNFSVSNLHKFQQFR